MFTNFLFYQVKVRNTWCYFYGLGHKMTGCVCLEVAISLLAMTQLELNKTLFVTLAAAHVMVVR